MNAERLAEGATGAYRELYDDPASAVERAGRAASALRDLARIDPDVQPTLQALETALVHLDETARVLRSYRDGVVFDPPRLEAIERRLDEIGRLKRKYGESVEAVLTLRARLETDLEKLAHAGEDEGRLAERVERLRTELVTRASDLAERREQAVGRLETSVLAELGALDLETRRVPGAPRAGPGRRRGTSPSVPRRGGSGRRASIRPSSCSPATRARRSGRSPASPPAASSRGRCSRSRSCSRRRTRCPS